MTVDEALTRQAHEGIPFAEVLGVEVIAASADEIRARVAWQPDRCTSDRALHGAVFMGLADVCGGISAFLNLPEGAVGTTTIESKTNFLSAVRGGWLNAVTTRLHRGRSTIVIVTDLFDDTGKLAGRVTQTQAVLEERGERIP
jgi:1,4-dihydroxy-2-naphthoyl-CoA hydrolase